MTDDIRPTREADAEAVCFLLGRDPTVEQLGGLFQNPVMYDAGLYLLAEALGHITEPIARIDFTFYGSGRPDCWEIRTVSVRALHQTNAGTPMHRFGGDERCSESWLESWMPLAPTDPARALAEAIILDGGAEGVLHGYSWIEINDVRREPIVRANLAKAKQNLAAQRASSSASSWEVRAAVLRFNYLRERMARYNKEVLNG